MKECPCHSKLPYHACCQKFHQGTSPPTALELMRSRYSAYALGLINYIIQTTHKESPFYQSSLSTWKKELKIFCKSTAFNNLEILHSEDKGSIAFVTFIATLMQGDLDVTFTEKSTFKKEGSRWFYLEGITYPGRRLI